MIRGGQVSSIVLLLVLSAAIVYRIRTTKKEQLPQIRPIAGLEAIDEAIGRATELGRPIHYSLGYGSLTADTAPQTLAGVAVLTRRCPASIGSENRAPSDGYAG